MTFVHRHDCSPRRGERAFGPGPGPGRGWRGRGGGEEGGSRRRMFDGGELRLILLALIAEQARHGYDLIRAIEERSGGAYAPSPGVIYPTLTMLADMGHAEEQKGEGARRLFAATPEGRAHLEERREEVAALLARLDAIASLARKTEGGPVRRAMHNLRNVLLSRLSQEDVTSETLHDVAALLDEVAQKIERL